MKEGFSDIIIPEQKIKTCSGCKHYEHRLAKSGYKPEYIENCNHPDITSDMYIGNLQKSKSGYVETPDWCPYLIIKVDEPVLEEYKFEYESVLKSGLFWEFFPEYSGQWNEDKEQFIEFKKHQNLK